MEARGRMSRAERLLDIAVFLHRNYLVDEWWVTIGEYARYAKVSTSPHLRGIFSEMLDNHILLIKSEPYRATVMYTFRLNYDVIEKEQPHLKHEIVLRVGARQKAKTI